MLSFDVVIPVGPNELNDISKQIVHIKKNVLGYRNIYIITNLKNNIQNDGCIMIDETVGFPFKYQDIADYFSQYQGKCNRNGWYFQQLLKLYVSFVMNNISDNYLIVDADVFFLKQTQFIMNNKPIFTVGREYWTPYFDHMKKLHPSLIKQTKYSGISHHMMFNRHYLKEMMDMVEKHHNNGKMFWQIFLESVTEHTNHNPQHSESGASEYELYFNFMIINHPDKICFRQLNWANFPKSFNLNQKTNFDYVSLCYYL
jgi:hypothetical protein